MPTTIDKRNFLKKLMSLCLLPFIPVSSLLSRRKEAPSRVAMNGVVQMFQRSQSPRVLKSMLNARLPLAFIPGDMRGRYMNGELTADDKMVIARMMRVNFEWAMDWVVKVLGKQIGAKAQMQKCL